MKTVWTEKGLTEFNTRLAFRIKCKEADRIELIALDFYNIYVNDEFLGFGPAKTAYGYARKDVYDLTHYKDFYITVEVCCHNIPAYSIDSGMPLFGAEIYKGADIIADTKAFECFNLDDTVQKVQKYSFQRGFSENYIMDRDRKFFRTGKTDFTKVDTIDVACPIILDRNVDYLRYNRLPCVKCESGIFEIDKNKEHWVESVQMTHDENMNFAFNREEIEEFVSDTVSEFVYIKKENDTDTLSRQEFFTYDFKRIVTGIFALSVEVEEDAEIYLSWSEHAEISETGYDMDFSRNTCCDIIKWKLKKGVYDLSSFEPYCGRFARINLLSGKVKVNDFYIKAVENPNIERVVFKCENKKLEKIIKASINTLAQNSVDIPMDCPGRERAGWLCDSYFIGAAEKLLFGNNKVERNHLENYVHVTDFSLQKFPKGMIPMCFPSRVPSGKFIPNWSLWFILEVKEYYRRSGDVKLVEDAKEKIYGLLKYFEQYENSEGLLEDLKSWVFVEWSRANDFTAGINYPTNMLYSAAMRAAGELYSDSALIRKADRNVSLIRRQSFNGEFFEDNAIRDEDGNLVRTGNTSETCQYYALFFDIATGDDFEELAEKMTDCFGRNRDDSKVYPKVYKSNAFIGNFLRLMYLLKAGEYKKVLDDCEQYFTHMAEKTSTLWEYDTVKNSMNHGFASYAACLIIESLKRSGLYEYEFYLKDDGELYNISASTRLGEDFFLTQGKSVTVNFPNKLNLRYDYTLRLVGEVDFDYRRRTERVWPIYFRKLDDSVIKTQEGRALVYNKENEVRERTCYVMIRDGFEIGETYELSVKAKIEGLKEKFTLSAEVYYGESKTRYYYETPDETVCLELNNTEGFETFKTYITINKKVDFVVLKLEAIDFKGYAEVICPELVKAGEERRLNVCYPYDSCSDDLVNFYWIGEGFSLAERPKFTVKLNGEEIFKGRKVECLHRFSGVEFDVPHELLNREKNVFEIEYDQHNIKSYSIKECRLIAKPRGFELLGVKKFIKRGEEFGVFCHLNSGEVTFEKSEYATYLETVRVDDGFAVIKLRADKTGKNVPLTFTLNGEKKTVLVEQITSKEDEYVITGTGDFIYVNQNLSEFAEYLSWYLKEGIGDLMTFRCVYHWGRANELNKSFWKNAVTLLTNLGIYYSLMIDGRELNGINANPDYETMKSKYYLGSQTHERDGAYIYWNQSIDRINEFYYHLLSRKMEQNGIYGKRSPVYDKEGNANIFYAPDSAKNLKEAYDNFYTNIKYTAIDGATRHTGVSTKFHTFFEAGYKWVGYESMYGPHEVLFGALRGTSKAYSQPVYGAHAALQWSTVPCDDVRHFTRYRLSLYLSYMHGVSEINTEEGLWRIENPFAEFDRYSYPCVRHRQEQSKFNRFIQTHTLRGKQKVDIAMIIGKYDGMEGFSSPNVFGQSSWHYDKPEESWDLIKVFYPESDLNAIYYYVRKGGEKNMPQKHKDLLKARAGLYRDIIDYKQVGFYTNTPYGVIDMIPWDATNMSDYKFIFFTGWNTASEQQLEKLLAFVEGGGKLLLAKPHLYDTVKREDALKQKAKVINSPLVDKILSYADRVIFIDEDRYPADYKDKYAELLAQKAIELSDGYITDTKHLSYTQYEQEDGSLTYYLLNIDWWDDAPAQFNLNIAGRQYNCSIEDNEYPRIITIKDGVAVYADNPDVDVVELTSNKVSLCGYGLTKLHVFDARGYKTVMVDVNEKAEIAL